ncbi:MULTISPECIES: hypothetical protein [Methylobacterium]|uniref:Uncharacterized protein n=1 Tax=Methylobacterium longum TaxID=767694 RepID=A0ABT8ARK5_9HYPH|nr:MULTISPECIES: hypothetical protein [Methylobacterium]MCJ2100780.1 hypothetical protein [Methylobacterium sp. E-046]MDN3572543.1 hypothetical protein [Methylobacterium longum]GJE14209.1 hypothetical protein FOHLNKBM_5282 [Methylobacterium longum]
MPEAMNPSEADVAATPDAVAGRAKVEARMAECTAEEQAAFWDAVGRCFGGGKPPDMEPASG